MAANARGRGVGRTLLRFAFTLARSLRDEVGCVGVVVDAKEESRTFYERLGFRARPGFQLMLHEAGRD